MSTEQEVTASLEVEQLTADDANEANIRFPQVSQKQLAWQDAKDGLVKWRIWFLLAYQDIKLRYRRSTLGPFWITLSMAITAYTMGYLYGHLFRVGLSTYYPFLVAGMIGWSLISSMLVDLTDTFMISENLIKQIKLPYTLYIHRIIARNIIIFFHNMLVMVPIFVIFHESAKINFNTLLLLPGLLLIYINAALYGLIIAMIGSRYRDISQIIKSLVSIIFFVTPVMWSPAVLPEHTRHLMYANPFYSFLELIRAPLIGTTPNILNVGVALITTVIGYVICAKLFVRYRSRIIYWL